MAGLDGAQAMTAPAGAAGAASVAPGMSPAGGMGGGQPMGPQPGQGQDQQETPNVTPQEQAQYNQFVGAAMKVMYDKKALPAIVDSLKGGGNPVLGLAHTLAMLVMRTQQAAEQKGVKFDPDVMYHGAGDLLKQLEDVAAKAKVHDYTDKESQAAFFKALEIYADNQKANGKLDTGALQQDMQGMAQAQQNGTLGQELPGLDEFAAQHQGQQQPSQPAGPAAGG